jgi:bacillolysin/thermolysin
MKQSNTKINVTANLNGTSSQSTKSNSYEDQKSNIFLHGKLSDKVQITEKDILAYLEQNKSSFTNISGANNFKIVSMEKDNLGYTKVKVSQSINDIPIRGSEIILHLDKDGVIKNVIGSINKNYKPLDNMKIQALSPNQAIDIAKKQFTYTALMKEPQAQKQIIIKDGAPTLIYSVNIYYTEPDIGNWDVLIDGVSGNIISKVSNIRYDGASTGTGKAVDGSTKSLNLYTVGKSYEMIDATKAMSGKIKTYSANNRQVEPGNLVTNTTNTFNTESLKASVSAHYYAGVVYDFYKNLFGRNSIDNNGMNIISTTHYGKSYDNAYWDGSQMVYGDGDGTEFTYLSGDLDVVAHELTHGVTQYTANLDYNNQSGALNESFSDVLGVLVETYDKYNVKNGGSWNFNAGDWVVGAAIYTPNTPGDALRSLANPTLYNQPDNMNNYVSSSDDESGDYGGVHTNSGITNKAAFLVAKSIGCNKTSAIYYRALTSYLTSNSDFSAARNALVSAASDLYGDSGSEVTAVNSAFDSVGITSSSN